MKKNNTLLNYRKRLTKVLLYIERNLDEEISLETLAKIAQFSPYHFHRIFSGMIGESVKSYVRHLRLNRAAHQLRFSEQQVTNIALDSGYDALESFSKAFRKKFSMNPRIYLYHTRRQRLADIKNFINQLPRGEIIMNVKIENISKMRVAFVRHIGPYVESEKAWQKLLACKSLNIDANTKFIGICHDDPEITAPDKIRYDACVTVSDSFVLTQDVDTQEIAAGKYAVAEYIGPYSGLAKIYAYLYGQWMPQNGCEPKPQPSFEIYKNDPHITPPEKLITEIYIPVK